MFLFYLAAQAAQTPPRVPDPGVFQGYDDLGIAAVLVFVIFLIIGLTGGLVYAFYTRKFVLGSTCDMLVANADQRTELALNEAREARDDLKRISEDFNANFARALDILGMPRRQE